MQDMLLSSIPYDQLKLELSETIKKELQTLFITLQPQAEKTEYLTRKQAAVLLGVSLPTLNEWTKSGLVPGYRIASRVRYKRASVEAALSQIKGPRNR